jgi:hypothetical protein
MPTVIYMALASSLGRRMKVLTITADSLSYLMVTTHAQVHDNAHALEKKNTYNRNNPQLIHVEVSKVRI